MSSFRTRNAEEQTLIRHDLLENGYTPLANVDKICTLTGWPNLRVSPAMVDSWRRSLAYQGTGIRIERGLCAIDVDINDQTAVDALWEVATAAVPSLQNALVRYGKGYKEMWLVRCDEQFGMYASSLHVPPGEDPEDPNTTSQRLEAFGGGHARQFGVFGAHTMREDLSGFEIEYEWADDDSPRNTPRDELPILTKREVEMITRMAGEVLTKLEWPRVNRSRSGEVSSEVVYDLTDDMMFDCHDGVTRSLDELGPYSETKNARCSASWLEGPQARNTTRCLVSRDHEDKVRVLELSSYTTHMAIRYEGDTESLTDRANRLYEALHAEGYEFDDVAFPDAPVSFQDLVENLLTNWAWCGERAQPCLPLYGREDQSQSVGNFRLTNIRGAYEIEGPRGGIRKVNPVDAWLVNEHRIEVEGYEFIPGAPPGAFRTPEGRNVVNSYRSHPMAEMNDGNRREYERTWDAFLIHLIPDDRERDWFLDWLAHKVQNPDIPGVGVIMVTQTYGVGRGSLFQIVEGLFGEHNVSNVSARQLTGEGSQSQYNDWVSRKLVVTVDEVLTAGDDGHHVLWKRERAYENLKELIDPRPRRMNIVRKTFANYQDNVVASFLMATNHTNALPIPENDRRIAVIQNNDVPMKEVPEVMQAMDAIRKPILNRQFVAAVHALLSDRDVNRFDAQVAPLTEAKTEMILSGASDMSLIASEVLATVPFGWGTLEELRDAVETLLRKRGLVDHMKNWRWALTDELRRVWTYAGRLHVGQRKVDVYCTDRRNKTRLADMTPEERDDEVSRRAQMWDNPTLIAALHKGLTVLDGQGT